MNNLEKFQSKYQKTHESKQLLKSLSTKYIKIKEELNKYLNYHREYQSTIETRDENSELTINYLKSQIEQLSTKFTQYSQRIQKYNVIIVITNRMT